MTLTGKLPPPPVPVQHGRESSPAISAAAADQLAAEASGLDGAWLLLDSDRLSDLLQHQVTVTGVRSKPGHSLVVAHTDTEGRAGWTMLSTDEDKFHKAHQRAADSGLSIQVHRAAPPYLFSGSIWTDPPLAKELFAARAALGTETPWRVLRYNPRRRVVAVVPTSSGQKVVRVLTTNAAPLRRTARTWRDLQIPVGRVWQIGRRGSATIAPLWGVGDLSRHPHPPAGQSTGAAIATLHTRAPHSRTASVAQPDPVTAANGLADVAPWAGRRAGELAAEVGARLAELSHTSAQIHGDLSPDQVLIADERSHKIRLIDLDRAGRGDPMRDLGSWVAACRRENWPDMIQAFLDGYSQHAHLDAAGLAVWEAYAHLAGSADFFRHREPDWPTRTLNALKLTEEALQR